MAKFAMIQTHKTLSGISLFLQLLNSREGSLFYSTWKSRGGVLIRTGALIGGEYRISTTSLVKCNKEISFFMLHSKSCPSVTPVLCVN